MKMSVLSFSHRGGDLGEKLKESLGGDYQVSHYHISDHKGRTRDLVEGLWRKNDFIVFISAMGIASRMIGPLLDNKKSDPGVVCMDDMGRFSISLLSGHLGGANQLANEIAEALGSIPVITTATDNRQIESPDIFAKRNGYIIEDDSHLTSITAMMVDGKQLGFYNDHGPVIDYGGVVRISRNKLSDCNLPVMILVTNRVDIQLPKVPSLMMRPSNINLGIGCRKGVSGERIIKFIYEVLSEEGLSPLSVGKVGTIEMKKDEPGIIGAVEHFGCKLKTFTVEDISNVQQMFMKSDFVNGVTGVHSVSAPVAHLLGGRMIREKAVKDGITLSVTEEV